jgi:hypothetical protein
VARVRRASTLTLVPALGISRGQTAKFLVFNIVMWPERRLEMTGD